MVVFLVQGVGFDNLIELTDIALDRSDESPFMINAIDTLEIECFDSSMGKVYKGAEALAMLLEYRQKSRRTGG